MITGNGCLGGRYGNATLVQISDEEIVLKRPTDRSHQALFFGSAHGSAGPPPENSRCQGVVRRGS